MRVISENIVLMMEAVHTSETSVYFYEITRRHMQEDSRLHNRRRENLKCAIFLAFYQLLKKFVYC
jgi:hypothetical protein